MLNKCISCKYAKTCADYSANYNDGFMCEGCELVTIPAPAEILLSLSAARSNLKIAQSGRENAENASHAAITAYMKMGDKSSAEAAELKAQLDHCRAQKKHYNDNIATWEQVISVHKHNLKIAYINAVLTAAPAILEKYNNKPYGEKTRAKIADDFKTETGARVYITNDSYISWSPGALTIYPDTYEINRIEIYTPYAERERVPLLSDKNRIIADNVETISDSNNKYIVDPSGYIEHLAELDDKVTEHAAKANTAIDNFNSFNVLENGNYCHIYLKK